MKYFRVRFQTVFETFMKTVMSFENSIDVEFE